MLLFDTNPASPPLFQIVTVEQARLIDIEENIAGANQEAAAAKREAAMKTQLDEANAKIAAQEQTIALLAAGQSRMERILTQILAGQAQPAAAPPMAVHDGEKVEAKSEQKAEAKTEAKPARPGERRDGNKQKPTAKPEAKADDEKADAKSAADAGDATAAYDESLKAEGFTPNR